MEVVYKLKHDRRRGLKKKKIIDQKDIDYCVSLGDVFVGKL